MALDQQLVTEIARCTNVKKFRGRLTEGAARKLPHVKPLIRIAIVGTSSVRLMGYRVIFGHESGFDLVSVSLPDMDGLKGIDLVILSNCDAQPLLDLMANLKIARPDLRIIVTGSGGKETILKAIIAGAKGYVDDAASPAEFVQAVRAVNQGSVWAPRQVLSIFIERASSSPCRVAPAGRPTVTDREKKVLELLVTGRSNKEIASPLGIEVRTVKAHLGKLMRKVGVQNRIELSAYALKHSLVSAR